MSMQPRKKPRSGNPANRGGSGRVTPKAVERPRVPRVAALVHPTEWAEAAARSGMSVTEIQIATCVGVLEALGVAA